MFYKGKQNSVNVYSFLQIYLVYSEVQFLLTNTLYGLQVLNAQRAGYKAAIVHNVDSDDLISMGSNDSKYRYHFFSPV